MALRRIARIFGITAAVVMTGCDHPPQSEPADTDEQIGEAEQALTSPATVPAAADTWVGEVLLNQGHGADPTLHVTSLGIQRSLVRMDQAAIAAAVGTGTVQSASLVLTIQSANNLWGPNGRPIRLHRLTTTWTEQGATWLCPNDTNLSNLLPDCNPLWFMGGLLQPSPWVAAPSAQATITNNQTGTVSFDVTADVQSFLSGTPNRGWVIQKPDLLTGRVDFLSKEGGNGPRLVLTVQSAGCTGPIDDDNPCTNDACVNGTVTHTPTDEGSSCSDGNPCNGAETCNGAGTCVAGTAPPLDDGNACTADSCDPIAGILHSPLPSGTSCSDGDACNGAEICDGAGQCAPGTPLVPEDDHNPCTLDLCDPGSGVVHPPAPASTSCSDGDPCNGNETCDGARQCAPGTPPSFDDGDDCTIDLGCVPGQGFQRVYCNDVDPSATTSIDESLSFLIEGPNPLQVGVAPGTIERARAGAIEGDVSFAGGAPAGGVHVEVHDHPELGSTVTAANGHFIMVVNAAKTLVVDISAPGFLPVQRTVETEAQRYRSALDVVLVPVDDVATTVDLDTITEVAVAQGPIETDEIGSRQATVLISPGTSASLRMPDGSLVDAPTLTLRLTEYTVGEEGPARMPAPLPPTSGYTYAVEISADEALEVGAKGVQFDAPVSLFVDNYRGMPVGTVLPVASYDRDRALWVPDDDALVIAILEVASGTAEIDMDGDGLPETDGELEAAGLDLETRATLASTYEAGAELWFSRRTHLSSVDCNAPFTAELPYCEPLKCSPSDPQPIAEHEIPDGCTQSGSVIECENQTLREDIPVHGTPFSLHYASDRVPGRIAAGSLALPVTGVFTPASVVSIEAKLTVAGRQYHYAQSCPCTPNSRWNVEWDGKDELGRAVQGTQVADYQLTYNYVRTQTTFAIQAQNFAQWGEYLLPGEANGTLPVTAFFSLPLRRWDARGEGLGGLTLSAVHHLDVASGTIYRGDGSREDGDRAESIVRTIVTRPAGASNGVEHVVALPNGEVAWDESIPLGSPPRVIRKLDKNGNIVVLAGTTNTCGPVSFNRPGVGACLPGSLAAMRAGPDGSIYFVGNNRAFRLHPNGYLELVAGTGVAGTTGDGGPATAATLRASSIAVGPDGAVYLGEPDKIRRVDPNGRIDRVLGAGAGGASNAGNDGFAKSARAGSVNALAFAPDGSLYFSDCTNLELCFVRKVEPGGIVRRVAGRTSGGIDTSDGILATDATLYRVSAIDVAPNGDLFLKYNLQPGGGGTRTQVIRRVGHDGRITRAAGADRVPGAPNSTLAFAGEGGPAAAALISTQSFSVADDRTFYFPIDRAIIVAHPSTSPYAAGGYVIGSRDGAEIYTFDRHGRHLATYDARRGTLRYSITHDAQGRLQSITDTEGNTTTIERDPAGDPQAIVGPYAHRTALQINTDGWATVVEDPTLKQTVLTYQDQSGLLEGFTTRDNHTTHFTWDAKGRLQSHTHPGGGTMTFVRAATPSGYSVEKTSPLGRLTTYTVERDTSNAQLRHVDMPNGLSSTSRRTLAEVMTLAAPDGTQSTAVLGPDPRFDMRSPIQSSGITQLPSGLTRASSSTRSATLSSALDPFSMTAWTETTTLNGRTSTLAYNLATRIETSISPAGRTSTRRYDALGRVVEIDSPGELPTTFQYDTRGRLIATTQGARTTTHDYGTDGLLAGSTNPLSETSTLQRNARGDVVEETRPDLATTALGYDGEGNTTSVIPPGKPEHLLQFNEINQLASYDPPDLGFADVTSYAYDLDKKLESVLQPGNRLIGYDYDAAGRLSETTFPGGDVVRNYSPSTGKLASLEGPYGVDLSFTYDGSVMKSVTWSGDVHGSVAWTHDTDFRISGETVNGASAVSFGYDADSLLTSAGGLTIVRDPASGRVTSATSVNVTETWTYNAYGEVASKTSSFNGEAFFAIAYERDLLGRISQKTETVLGVTTVTEYEYDNAGRLVTVTEDGTLTESYSYDANGNRESALNSAGVASAAFDGQDRIISSGDFEYDFTDNGELQKKTNLVTGEVTSYVYDAVGNLIQVTLPSGDVVEYLVDAMRRRVGKKVNGVLERQWLWRGKLQPVAELDGAGNLVARFVYAGGVNVPELMVAPSGTYRLVKDHLGSVRFVTNVATGAVVQEIRYDAWGRVLVDTNPGLQPFGFAGGLYDGETGLVRFGTRDHDAETGRWTAKDPIRFGGGVNLFEYGASDPMNMADWTGRDPGGMSHSREYRAFWDNPGSARVSEPPPAEATADSGAEDAVDVICLFSPGGCLLGALAGCGVADNDNKEKRHDCDPSNYGVRCRTECSGFGYSCESARTHGGYGSGTLISCGQGNRVKTRCYYLMPQNVLCVWEEGNPEALCRPL